MKYKEWLKIKEKDTQEDIEFKEDIKNSDRGANLVYWIGAIIMLGFNSFGLYFAEDPIEFMIAITPGLIIFLSITIICAIIWRLNITSAQIHYRFNKLENKKRSKK